MTLFKAFLITCLFTLSSPFARAANDQLEIETLLSNLNSVTDFGARLESVTHYLDGRPYLEGGPLGEGQGALYDQDPLFRMDGFDCTTFVETSLSLARAKSFNDFYDKLIHIRYQDGKISFPSRNHFVEIDWNPNNIAAQLFTDVSPSLGTENDHPTLFQNFSKKDWYANLTLEDLKIPGASRKLLEKRLIELHHEGAAFADVLNHPLTFIRKGALLKIKNDLPVPAVFNVVHESAGSSLNAPKGIVSHQVLLIVKDGQIHVRQSSSKPGVMKVTDLSYEEYVETLISSPALLGVNVLKINP